MFKLIELHVECAAWFFRPAATDGTDYETAAEKVLARKNPHRSDGGFETAI
jgi:hypothetical protein